MAKPFEQESELDEKEARLALLNADLNIDGDGDMDVMNDTENRDIPDEVFDDEPDGEAYGENEPDDEPTDITRPNYGYASERVPQTASAKTKPSILDGIRSFDSSKHNGVSGNIKPAERDI